MSTTSRNRVAVFVALCWSLLALSAVAQPPGDNGETVQPPDPVADTGDPLTTDQPLTRDNPFQFDDPDAVSTDQPSDRVTATPASERRSNQPTPSNFTIRLARAPKMLGDFFGRGGIDTETSVHFGRAVHHITSADDLHLIDEGGPVVLYNGGPGGGIYFSPSMSPPLPSTVTGLSYNGRHFEAELSGDMVDVYNDEEDEFPDITDAEVYNVYEIAHIALPNPSAGDIVGRVRLQDNNSPIPQDRIFFDYNFFHNVPFAPGGIDVHRFTPGVERTYWNKMASVEIRVPMGITLNSNVYNDLPLDVSNYELGNIVFASKYLLTSTDECAFTVGYGVSMPTADDLNIGMADGTRLVMLNNESVHLLPYLAFLYAPRAHNVFMQAFLTFDIEAKGTPVYVNANGRGLEHVGKWQDQNLATFSFSMGSWCYENYRTRERLKRIGWSAELHYTATLNDADSVMAGDFVIGDPNADLSLLNGTVGGHVTLGATTFTVGYSAPITSSDRVFDGELRCFANRQF